MSTKSQSCGLGRFATLLAVAGTIATSTLIAGSGPASANFGSRPNFHQYCPAAHSGSVYIRRTNRNGFAPRCRQFGTEHDIDARAICRWWSGSTAHHWVRNRRRERIQLHCNRPKSARVNPRSGPKAEPVRGRRDGAPDLNRYCRKYRPNTHARYSRRYRRWGCYVGNQRSSVATVVLNHACVMQYGPGAKAYIAGTDPRTREPIVRCLIRTAHAPGSQSKGAKPRHRQKVRRRRVSLPAKLRGCGLAGRPGAYGEVPTPCPRLRGGYRVRLETSRYYFKNGVCSPVWIGNVPRQRCRYGNRTLIRKVYLHAVCRYHWFRTRGYDMHQGTIPKTVLAKARNTRLITRFVNRKLTCFVVPYATYRQIFRRHHRHTASRNQKR